MNKTTKIIDLLNKIANGEEVPKKIKYNNKEYEEDNCYFIYEALGKKCERDFKPFLNDTVEIIEDDDKAEKIEKEELFALDESMTKSSLVAWQKANNGMFKKQIDFLIDHINKIEERLDER